MNLITPLSTLEDVAYLVCTALHKRRTTAVLTGGNAASFYAPQAYLSADIDFVIEFSGGEGSEAGLLELGFERNSNYYSHPHTRLTLDFPIGPLGVGEDLIYDWSTFHRKDQLLHVLTPTDCVRDRLAGYLFWNDAQSLETAVAVAIAQRRRIDDKLVADWCRREGHADKHRQFLRLLERRSSEG